MNTLTHTLARMVPVVGHWRIMAVLSKSVATAHSSGSGSDMGITLPSFPSAHCYSQIFPKNEMIPNDLPYFCPINTYKHNMLEPLILGPLIFSQWSSPAIISTQT